MLRLLLRVPFAGALTVLLVLQSAPVRAQDTRVRIMDDGVTQGASTILNCTGGLGCTVADGIAILAGGAGEGGGMADPGANGIVKRVAANITTPAIAGTDYVLPSGSITGNAATATALAADPADCTAGNAPLGITATGAVTGCFDVIVPSELTTATAVLQPLDADLTTLAGKTLVGTGATVRFTTGTFTAGNAITTDANGNLIDTGNPVSFLTDNSVTNAILADMPANTVLGRLSTSGDPQNLTGTQQTTLLDIFTTSLKGLAPASGGGTTNFLRADGTWAAPPGGGAGSGDALTSSSLAQFAPTTSAELAGVMTNETGSGVLVFATSPTLTTPNLGTPSALDLVNATGLPIAGLSGLGGGIATWLGSPSSSNLALAVTGETGSGAVVFGTAPTLDSPVLTTPTLNSPTLSTPTVSGQLTVSGSGIEITESDTNPACADGNYTLYADASEGKVKFCENGQSKDIAAKTNVSASAPASSDDSVDGYSLFSLWAETTSTPDVIWLCVDATLDNAVWVALNAPIVETQGIQEAANINRKVGNANNTSSAVMVGVDDGDGNFNEVNEGGRGWYYDPALGNVEFTLPVGNTVTDIASTFAALWRYSGTEIVRLDETGFVYSGSARPLQSVEVQGFEFGACTYAEAVIATNKPKAGLLTCTDSNSDGFDFDFMTPANWNAGTVTVTLTALNTNAAPSGNLVLSCSGNAVGDNEVVPDKNTTGEVNSTLTFATQNREEIVTSSAITINSAPAAGNRLYMHCDIDATGTTTTQMADVRIHPVVKVSYTKTKTSE